MIAEQGHLPAEVLFGAAAVGCPWGGSGGSVCIAEDATLVKVDPLVRTPDDRVTCAGRRGVALDANADFRRADGAEFEDHDATGGFQL